MTTSITSIVFASFALMLPIASLSFFAVAAPIIGLLAYTSITITSHLNELSKLNETIKLYERYSTNDFNDPLLIKEFNKEKEKHIKNASTLRHQIAAKFSIAVISSTIFITIGILAPIFLPTMPAMLAIAAVGIAITIAAIVANKLVHNAINKKIKANESNSKNNVNTVQINKTPNLDKTAKPGAVTTPDSDKKITNYKDITFFTATPNTKVKSTLSIGSHRRFFKEKTQVPNQFNDSYLPDNEDRYKVLSDNTTMARAKKDNSQVLL